MFEKFVLVVNGVCSFLVVIPLLVIFYYYKQVVGYLKHLMVYLIVAFLTELISLLSFYVFNHALTNSSLFFTLFEVTIVCLMLSYWNKPNLKIYYSVLFVYFVVWVVCTFAIAQPLYNVVFGLAGVMLIVVSIHFLFASFIREIPAWMTTIVVAFLLYEVLSTTIFAFMQFFIQQKHNEYISAYYLIHSFANAALYLLLSYGIIKCKKQLSQAL